jgi:hypothetical protein
MSWNYEYGMVQLGEASTSNLLRKVMIALGFRVSSQQHVSGLSGLNHVVDCMAVDQGGHHVVVVLGSKRSIKDKKTGIESVDEAWVRDTLFSSYDIRATFEAKDHNCDIIVFDNRLMINDRSFIHPPSRNMVEWLEDKGLNLSDIRATCGFSMHPYEFVPSVELVRRAAAIGSGFISLGDFSFDELTDLCKDCESASTAMMSAVLERSRLHQFFRPPTDELLLGVAAKTRLPEGQLGSLVEMAKQMGHLPTENAVLKDVPYDDPVAVVRELEKHRLVSCRAKFIHVTQDGKKILYRIEKTAEENFFIRLAKALDLPGLVAGIARLVRG